VIIRTPSSLNKYVYIVYLLLSLIMRKYATERAA